ncbi:MAG: YfgM family protein [Sandaracinaceae bacterium]
MAHDERDEENEHDEDESLDEGADDEESDEDEGSDDDGSDDGSDDDGSDDDGSDDDGSDDDGSDDDGSDDDGSDDDGADDGADDDGSDDSTDDDDSDDDSDDDDSDDTSADDDEDDRPKPRAKPAKKGKHKGTRTTAATRLAAARAAKAAAKAAKRGRDKKDDRDVLTQAKDSELGQRVASLQEWMEENKNLVLGGIAAILLGLVGWLGYQSYTEGQAEEAATLLDEALEIAQAEIREEGSEEEPAADDQGDEDEDEDDDAPTYPSVTARAEAALAAYDRVIAEHGSSDAAPWAHLGRARALLDLGRDDDARAAFDQAVSTGGSDPAVVWRALEGKGFSYEANEDWDHAREVYDELAGVDDGAYAPVARYHIARMQLAKGERDEATETLRALVHELRGAENDEDEQEFAYVLAQAEVRLRELAPSEVPARPTLPGLGGGEAIGVGEDGETPQLTDEQLQELIRRFQENQQNPGGGGE